MNISAGPDLRIQEVDEAANIIYEAASKDAQIFFGTVFDEECTDEMRITVIATGIEKGEQPIDTTIESSGVHRMGNLRRIEHKPRQTNRRPAPAASEEERQLPAYLRKKSGKDEDKVSLIQGQKVGVASGEDDFIFEDEEDFEIPSFIRKQVD